MKATDEKLKEAEHQYSKYLKYSNVAIQMGIIIALGAWGGQKLDERFQNETPYFTIFLSLLAVIIAILIVIRSVLSDK